MLHARNENSYLSEHIRGITLLKFKVLLFLKQKTKIL